MLGSRERESLDRWVPRASGVVNVKVADEGCAGSDGVDWDCSVERMAACEGSRREASMSDRVGTGVGIDGGGGGACADDEDIASHAASSASSLDTGQFKNSEGIPGRSYRCTSSSSSFNVAWLRSLTGFGFFTTGVGTVSSWKTKCKNTSKKDITRLRHVPCRTSLKALVCCRTRS